MIAIWSSSIRVNRGRVKMGKLLLLEAGNRGGSSSPFVSSDLIMPNLSIWSHDRDLS